MIRGFLQNLFFIFCLSACYEGWEYENGSGPGIPDIPSPDEKSIHYILLHTYSPSSEAFDEPFCGLNTNYKEYRINEWAQRISTLTESLRAITDTLVVKNVQIPASECETMNSIFITSLDPEPWGSEDAPTQDPKGRMSFQIRASFWDSDITTVLPNSNVYDVWAAWADFENGGRNVDTINYFVLSNENNGYFSHWAANSQFSNNGYKMTYWSGNPIDQPDPTPEGMNSRTDTINGDTSTFVSLVLDRATGAGLF